MSPHAPLGGRIDYEAGDLTEDDLLADPMLMLATWLEAAEESGAVEPTGMALATADSKGRPSCRVVLLRRLDQRGLAFFSHYESRKGHQLGENPRAAATFWWATLHRQVRVEGKVGRLSAEESDVYFATRPRESQLASASSPQSQPIRGREELEAEIERLDQAHPDVIPRPKHWGGYLLVPESIEFWQGRPARLHDRFLFSRVGAAWRVERLAP